MTRLFPRLIILAWGLSAAIALAGDDRAGIRPAYEFDTQEAFDSGQIPAYAGAHDAVHDRIDADIERHIGELQRWVRQRSISAQDDGIDAMAGMLAGDLRRLGFAEVDIVETDGHPGVFGHYDAGAEKTLVVYMMYDVQPVEDNWQIDDPFAGELVETELGTVLMARGATNQKGPERAFLNALDAIIATEGTLPVNLYVVAEGEEELGSTHFDQVLAPYADRLREADGAYFPMNLQGSGGSVSLNLGVKGIVYFELRSAGGDWGGPRDNEIHGSYKAVVDAPALRLVNAIASMTSADGNTVLIDGWYEGLRGPTPEEQRLINGMVERDAFAGLQESLGVERWVQDLESRDLVLRYLFEPTLNINGIWSGYTGEGGKTILPQVATAKIDSRLPPGREPEQVWRMIRDHLDRHGYADLEIVQIEGRGYPAASTSVESGLVRTAISVFNRYGHPPAVSPWLAGSAPFYQFTDHLDLPFVFGGLGHGAGAHAPDEFMLIHPAEGVHAAGLAEVEKFYADLLFAFAEG
ncbi:M20/M25/M40 family metallo-hydrolase [Wenzhouxiangella sediminis]|uniref:M20/M25/M40 family metallo-hydrolase n=1 Tax=Wenzhouxiangella sediminis TaxID=1792836 RepID=A0A3E1KD32_9GAMM|nr:M20/M25/M40 family metallo-hydrolase [Wenzhouxiangella sediminis]RFF33023.1 M20/M25/M40 family metallo-hydrolase [Wenzhouxiangella sediminis]